MKKILLLLIFSTLLFSNIETNSNLCSNPYPINQLDNATDSSIYSENYFSRWSSKKDIYLNFKTLVDGELNLKLLKSANNSMRYKLFIGKDCNDISFLVTNSEFKYDHNITMKISKNQNYIIKLTKEKNGFSRYKLEFNFKSLKPVEKTNGLIAKYYGNENFKGVPELSKIDKNIDFNRDLGVLNIPNYSVKWSGYIYMPNDGDYHFRVNQDDNIKLFVNDENIYERHISSNGKFQLSHKRYFKKGYYPIEIYYNTSKSSNTLQLAWVNYAISKELEIIESENLFTYKPTPPSTISDLILNISNGEKVEPIVIKNSFKEYYAQFDKDVNIAITLKLTPIFILLNDNYEYYKEIIIEMFEDRNSHQFLRLPMLEILSNHIKDKEALNSIKKIFDTKTDDSLIVGKTAKILSKNGIDISKEVENRYPNSKGVLKGYYAKILAISQPQKSRAMIEKDMDNEMDGNKKIKLISAFAKTGINDDYVVNKLMDMLYNTIPNSNFNSFEKELFSDAILYALSKSNRDDRFNKLLDMASNSIFSLTTRASALDELYYQLPKNKTIDKSDIKIRLQQLSQDILSSNLLKNEKNYLNGFVIKILNNLKGF